MAKVGLWLRGARGKYAGGVLQKGVSGGTIVRENVKPANPQSSNQCGQRMKMLPASRFYTLFEEVLSTSFEGVAYGNKSRWAFLKRALASPAVVCPKGAPSDYFPPLKVDVSTGSLPAISANNLSVVDEDVRMFELNTFGYQPTDAESIALGKWNETAREDIEVILRKIFGLPADGFAQITFIWQKVGEEHVFFDSLPRLTRKYARIKLGYGLGKESGAADTYTKVMQDIVFEAGAGFGCKINSIGDPDGLFGNVGALAVITSAFVDGVWKRSTSRYVVEEGLDLLYFDNDALLEESRASYVKSYNASSDEYLNGGVV